MKRKLKRKCYISMKKIIWLVVFLLLPISSNASSVEEQTKALLETAWAYYRQGEQVQYDSFRKNLYSTPEDATLQHYNYTVCSGFTFSVYYHTFGIKLPDLTAELLEYAKKNKDNVNIVKYYKGSESEIYTSDVLGDSLSNVENLAKKWVEFLMPGDIFVVEGHAMLIVSVDKENGNAGILESRYPSKMGSYTNHVDRFEKGGSIKENTLINRLNGYYNSSNRINGMAIIRIINDAKIFLNENDEVQNYDLTSSAKGRIKNKLIDIEKTADISTNNNANDYADINDIITYTITIKNTNKVDSNISYNNLKVYEEIDTDKVEFYNVENNSVSNNRIEWEIDNLAAEESWSKSYSVRVKNVPDNLGKLIVSTGNVDGIPTSKIETFINIKFTKEENNKITETYNNLLNNDMVEREFINQIYKNALNLDLCIDKLRNFDILKYNKNIDYGGSKLSVKNTDIINECLKKYIYNNNYGLRFAPVDDESNNLVRSYAWNIYPEHELLDKARNLEVSSLRHGDVILINTGNTSPNDTNLVDKSYIYLNNELIRKVSSTEFEKLSGDTLVSFLRNMLGENHVLLRPSLLLERKYSDLTTDNNNDNQQNNVGSQIENDEKVNPETGSKQIVGSMLFLVILLICLRIYMKRYVKKIF